MKSQWDKWLEVADDGHYNWHLLPWQQFIDQNDDWNGEFLNVNWVDQYKDFVESEKY